MSENVLFVRSEEDDNDPWDDTILIKAYDAALAKAKKEIEKEEKGNNQTKPASTASNAQAKSKWRKNMPCRAQFSEDKCIYEANVVKLKGDSAVIRFVGYGNVETVKLHELEPSQGNHARRVQKREARLSAPKCDFENESMEVETEESANESCSSSQQPIKAPNFKVPNLPSRHTYNQPHEAPPEEEIRYPPPPPPPPGLFHDGRVPGDDETLYAMLMSWYMSGYHTGYFEGRKASKSK